MRVLLATDGSEDAVLAGRAAVDLATRDHSRLHVVHAWQTILYTRFDSIVWTEIRREAATLLERQVEQLEAILGRPLAEAHLREGPEVDEILDLAGEIEADLIVLGSRGHGPVARLVMGSVSEGVVHHADRPVLVVRGGEGAWPPSRIVVGDDGSDTARDAARFAGKIARLYNTKMLLLRSYPRLPEIDPEGRASDTRLVDDELRREEKKLAERALDLEESLETRPRIRIDVGNPTVCLLKAADEEGARGTLIATGSRGLGTIRRMRLGSVSTKILRAAEGPVLIHPRPRESDGSRA